MDAVEILEFLRHRARDRFGAERARELDPALDAVARDLRTMAEFKPSPDDDAG